MDVGKICREVSGHLIDVVMPPVCLSCGAAVQSARELCMDCWGQIQFLSPPWCTCCGMPFAYDEGGGALCGACTAHDPAYDRARAVYVYSDSSRDMILKFKHGDRTDLAPAFAHWMARAGKELLESADLITPVPLHRWRLLRRRYNQAALIAGRLAQDYPADYVPDLIRRVKNTGSQGGLNRQARFRNLTGAFQIKAKTAKLLADRRVLVIDDVLTTGATAEACAALLKRHGAASVDILTIARIVRDEI